VQGAGVGCGAAVVWVSQTLAQGTCSTATVVVVHVCRVSLPLHFQVGAAHWYTHAHTCTGVMGEAICVSTNM
jgi:hypothetical protein